MGGRVCPSVAVRFMQAAQTVPTCTPHRETGRPFRLPRGSIAQPPTCYRPTRNAATRAGLRSPNKEAANVNSLLPLIYNLIAHPIS